MSIPYLPYVVAKTSPLRNDFFLAALVGALLTGLTFYVSLAFGWLTFDAVNWFEVAAVFFNYASFYLCVKQRRAYYIIGMLGYVAFVVVYLQANLIASTFLSAYLSIALIVGFIMWGRDDDSLPVSRVKPKLWPAYVGVTLAAFGGAWLLVSALGGSFAPWDSVILIFTLLAQFLLDRKKIENWAVWIVFVNGAGAVLYFTTELYFIAIQQLLFGIFSVWGWYEWHKSLVANNPVLKEARVRGDYEHMLSRLHPIATHLNATRAEERLAKKHLERWVANGEGLDH